MFYFALIFQFIGALLYFVIFPQGTLAQGIYTLTKILIIVWPLLWLKHIKTSFTLRPNAAAVRYGLISGAIGASAILGLFFAFQNYWMQFSPQLIEKLNDLNLHSASLFIFFALFLSLAHSLLEEYYWRWFVFTGLSQKHTPLAAGIISSIAFASHHYIILSQFFPLFITIIFGTLVGLGGAWWCYVYRKTGTLFGNWISHAMIDAAIMTVGFVMLF